MIYCVRFAEVVSFLDKLGFREIGRGEAFRAYELADGTRLTIRPPNADGNLPEILVNDALETSGVTPPTWSVFWCD